MGFGDVRTGSRCLLGGFLARRDPEGGGGINVFRDPFNLGNPCGLSDDFEFAGSVEVLVAGRFGSSRRKEGGRGRGDGDRLHCTLAVGNVAWSKQTGCCWGIVAVTELGMKERIG